MFGKGQKGRRKNDFADFINKNKSLKVLLPLLLISIIAVVIVYSTLGNNVKPASSQLNQQKNDENLGQAVDVLPQIERAKNPDIIIDDKTKDPFSSDNAAMLLKGITIYKDKNTAIIETQNSAYVVCEGDVIEGWNVRRIDTDGVLLVNTEGNEYTLKYKLE